MVYNELCKENKKKDRFSCISLTRIFPRNRIEKAIKWMAIKLMCALLPYYGWIVNSGNNQSRRVKLEN